MLLVKFLAILLIIGVPFVLFAYAAALFNFIFMFVPSGEIRTLIRGASFHRAVINIAGRTINRMTNDIVALPPGKKDPNLTWFNRLFGLYFVGIPPFQSVFGYKFKWPKIDLSEDEKSSRGFHIQVREEMVYSLFFSYAYPMVSTATEIQGNVPYDIDVVATIEVVNPEKALFKVLPSGQWLTRAQAMTLDAVRRYASTRTVDELRENVSSSSSGTGSKKGAKSDFESTILGIVNGTATKPGKLIEQVGVKIASINMISIQVHDPTGDGKLAAALTAQVVAQEQAKATVAEAEGYAKSTGLRADADAGRINKIAEADAKRVTSVIGEASKYPGGTAVLATESMERAISNSKAQTLVLGGNPSSTIMVPTTTGPAAPTTTPSTP